MTKNLVLIFLFLSGAAGLVYEIIWTRQLIFIFGSTTYTVVTVLSSFMAGLALGAYLFGRISDRFGNLFRLYALLELGIGLTTLFVPASFLMVRQLYLAAYIPGSSEVTLVLIKLLLSAPIIIIPTTLMGGTLPVIVRLFRQSRTSDLGNSVSLAYAINTAGAVLGSLLGAFVFIEIFGLFASSRLASITNLIIGFITLFLSQKMPTNALKSVKGILAKQNPLLLVRNNFALFLAFGLSGLISMGYEVLWSRLLTPLTGTFIYAFGGVLALFLTGIALGSFLVRFLFRFTLKTQTAFALTQFAIALGAFFLLVLTSESLPLPRLILIPLMILPATIAMGMTFPIVSRIKIDDGATGSAVGTLYAFNTVGSLLGPIITGFLLIPLLGTVNSLFLFILANFLLGLILLSFNRVATLLVLVLITATVAALQTRPLLFQSKPIKDKLYTFRLENYHYQFLEDYTASVLAYRAKDKWDNGLLVDGVGMSQLVDETKFMAHLPLLFHKDPKDVLVICFGMGTTFRSALAYGVNVDAVDLVPSVPQTFPVFFDNAQQILENPRGKIHVNDGRNYVLLTDKNYDIITVDPPPPVNSAGTTLLYSREFYQDSKRILRPGGIFSQWFHEGTKEEDYRMLLKTFIDQFNYVAAFRSPNHMGRHVLASDEPIILSQVQLTGRLHNATVSADLREWSPYWNPDLIIQFYYGDKAKLERFVGTSPVVTDDHPKTEYFLLRHRLQPQVNMEADNLPL